MNILITGAGGFIGKNLAEALKNIRDGKDRTRNIRIDNLDLYDTDGTPEQLAAYTARCDFVFHLAGVNRPKDIREFMEGNCGFLEEVLALLKQSGNTCPVMLSSSVQAALDNEYGKSKRAGETCLAAYARETGAKVLIYRFPNVFGKWCRPNYNSAVATFCYNIARDLPITVNDRNTVLNLIYIDDVVNEMLEALEGREHRNGDFCEVPTVYTQSLGDIVGLLETFHRFPQTLLMTPQPDGSFEKKLYAAYLSYLPPEKAVVDYTVNRDARGSFTELLHTPSCGQFSVNVSEPGVAKGQHWHHTKWELFIVVSGEALIQQRQIGSEAIAEFRVSGDRPQAVCMLPGYTHNIINLSDTEKLVTLMWASENFDAGKPDTYAESVK